MTTVKDIIFELELIAPLDLSLEGDNCGLIVGSMDKPVNVSILALDVTNEVIDMAIKRKAELIITHHPVIYKDVKQVLSNSVLYRLIQNDIAVVSGHTNLDVAMCGTNCELANRLDLVRVNVCKNTDKMGRLGKLRKPLTGEELALFVKTRLGAPLVQVTNKENKINTVCVLGGSGDEYMKAAFEAGADAFITGEVRHYSYIDAINTGVTLITAGHHHTESPVLYAVKARLKTVLNELVILIYDDYLATII